MKVPNPPGVAEHRWRRGKRQHRLRNALSIGQAYNLYVLSLLCTTCALLTRACVCFSFYDRFAVPSLEFEEKKIKQYTFAVKQPRHRLRPRFITFVRAIHTNTHA